MVMKTLVESYYEAVGEAVVEFESGDAEAVGYISSSIDQIGNHEAIKIDN